MKLLITNGDCVGEMLKASVIIQGDIVCWRDLLHDGPVLDLPYEEYSSKRTAFLTDLVTHPNYLPDKHSSDAQETLEGNIQKRISADFSERFKTMNQLQQYDEIVLFFEHDLYDQLQLAEICQRLLEYTGELPKTSIICINQHPEVPFFHGLGNLSIAMLEELYPQRVQLSKTELRVGQSIWQALIANTPQQLTELIKIPVNGWPFMQNALLRFAREYPAVETGLTLTQTYILLTLLKEPEELPAFEHHLKQLEAENLLPKETSAQQRYYEMLTGPATFRRIFHHLQQLESAPFLGDLSVSYELNRLIAAPVPYVNCVDIKQKDSSVNTVFTLTNAGAEALQGIRHWLDGNSYNFWRGGAQITNENAWEWSQSEGMLLQSA